MGIYFFRSCASCASSSSSSSSSSSWARPIGRRADGRSGDESIRWLDSIRFDSIGFDWIGLDWIRTCVFVEWGD